MFGAHIKTNHMAGWDLIVQLIMTLFSMCACSGFEVTLRILAVSDGERFRTKKDNCVLSFRLYCLTPDTFISPARK